MTRARDGRLVLPSIFPRLVLAAAAFLAAVRAGGGRAAPLSGGGRPSLLRLFGLRRLATRLTFSLRLPSLLDLGLAALGRLGAALFGAAALSK